MKTDPQTIEVLLVIPRPPVVPHDDVLEYQIPLVWQAQHAASSYGGGVLFLNHLLFDGHAFRWLRDRAGAWILTNNQEAVCKALGVPGNEPGIQEKEGACCSRG